MTDARFQSYSAKYGDESWELDALDPTTLTALVEKAVKQHRDPDAWRMTVEAEIEDRAMLKAIKTAWPSVCGWVESTRDELLDTCRRQLEEDYEDELPEGEDDE
jgi:hypothetical protein